MSGLDDSIINSVKEFKIGLDELFSDFRADTSLIREIIEDLSEGDDEITSAADRKSDSMTSLYDEAIKSSINELIIKKKLSPGNKILKKILSIKKIEGPQLFYSLLLLVLSCICI